MVDIKIISYLSCCYFKSLFSDQFLKLILIIRWNIVLFMLKVQKINYYTVVPSLLYPGEITNNFITWTLFLEYSKQYKGLILPKLPNERFALQPWKIQLTKFIIFSKISNNIIIIICLWNTKCEVKNNVLKTFWDSWFLYIPKWRNYLIAM